MGYKEFEDKVLKYELFVLKGFWIYSRNKRFWSFIKGVSEALEMLRNLIIEKCDIRFTLDVSVVLSELSLSVRSKYFDCMIDWELWENKDNLNVYSWQKLQIKS